MEDRSRVISDPAAARALSVDELPSRPAHETAVIVEPQFFDREYVINPHMGGTVDKELAREQWERLRTVYKKRADNVRVLDPAEIWSDLDQRAVPRPENRPDMVFVANHAVPTADGSGMVLARMVTDERAGEPEYFRAWAEQTGYEVLPAPNAAFEGMGDALWHPNRQLLWGGYGVRSEREAYDDLAARLDATIIPLELTDEQYYHLDVSLAPLSESEALIQPEAFTPEGRETIEAVFDRVLEAPAEESTEGLAVNVEVVDETVILGDDLPETTALLEDAGYDVISVDTSEFQKAGGSVCCLTLSAGTPN